MLRLQLYSNFIPLFCFILPFLFFFYFFALSFSFFNIDSFSGWRQSNKCSIFLHEHEWSNIVFPNRSWFINLLIKNIASCRRGEKMYIEINSTRLLFSHLFPLLKCYLSRARFRYLRITNLHPISLPPSLPSPPPFVITRSLRKSSIFNVINIDRYILRLCKPTNKFQYSF